MVVVGYTHTHKSVSRTHTHKKKVMVYCCGGRERERDPVTSAERLVGYYVAVCDKGAHKTG